MLEAHSNGFDAEIDLSILSNKLMRYNQVRTSKHVYVNTGSDFFW